MYGGDESSGMLHICKLVILGEELLNKTSELYETVKVNTGFEGQDSLKQEIEQLKQDWTVVKNTSNNAQIGLDKYKTAWTEFTNVYDSLAEWVKDFKEKLDTEETVEKTVDDLGRVKV